MSDQPGYRPSNGTEDDMFRAWNCEGCTNDHLFHEGDDSGGCVILARAYSGGGTPEWVHDPDTGYPGNARCIKWAGPCACVGLFDLKVGNPDGHTTAMFLEFHQ